MLASVKFTLWLEEVINIQVVDKFTLSLVDKFTLSPLNVLSRIPLAALDFAKMVTGEKAASPHECLVRFWWFVVSHVATILDLLGQ
jgi:hypothetical protein